MTSLHRLIYVSAASGNMTLERLDAILKSARTNNETAGVTGLLLFHEGSFFQTLEGPKPAVERIFARIQADPRHAHVIVLQNTLVDGRAFPNWSMGFMNSHQLRPEQKSCLVDLRAFIGGLTQPLSSSPSASLHITAFLSSFREFAEV